MPATDSTTKGSEDLAKRFADAEAKLSYEQARADHAEQIVEAHISFLSGQDNVPTPPHSSLARSPRNDTLAHSRTLNFLEII